MDPHLEILIVEDNPADVILLREALVRDIPTGIELTTAEGLNEALGLLQNCQFDIILLDLGLPDSVGMETFTRIHQLVPKIPTVILSGLTDESFALEAVQAGAQDYLVKGPAGWDLSARAIRYAIERHKAQIALNESEARFAIAFRASPISTAITRLSDGKLVDVNAAWERIVGIPREQAIGRTAVELEIWKNPAERENLLRELKENRELRNREFQICFAAGELKDVLLSADLIDFGGEPCTLSMAVDISDRKRAEAINQKRAEQLAALHEIDMVISNTFDLRLTLDVLLRHVLTQLNVDAAAVLLFNPYLQMLEYAAGVGFRYDAIQKTRIRLGEGCAGRAALERRRISTPNMASIENDCIPLRIALAEEHFMAHHVTPLIVKGQIKGVLEIFHRAVFDPSPEWLEFFQMLAGQAAIGIDNAQLFQGLQQSTTELALSYDATLEGWSRALDLRDKETEGHSQRVTELAVRLARAVGINDADLVQIQRGALLHDIGKLGVPDEILLKAGPLTDAEWDRMKRHPQFAFDLLLPIAYLRQAIDIPYCHHEKWDGTGYPRGLHGEHIPLAARVFALADTWDALRSRRPYRDAWDEERTRAYLREQSGKHFDPRLVEMFLNLGL